jgi:dTMP kinase
VSGGVGRFIVLDGVEGCGKTTQAGLLAARLQEKGIPHLLTHEPGGTPLGRRLRHLLLEDEAQMTSLTEVLLFCADRAEHVASVIVPALLAGRWVICDRFSSSTFAYQVWAGEADQTAFLAVDEIAREPLKRVRGEQTGSGQPDLTIILDLDPATGRARKAAPDSPPDKIEQRSADYHRRVREGFLRYARDLAGAAVVVAADREPPAILREILTHLGLDA